MNRFWIFEGGLRSVAEMPFRLTKVACKCSSMEMLLDETILGYSQYNIDKEDPYLHGRCGGGISFAGKRKGLKK